jgi:signal peptidase I
MKLKLFLISTLLLIPFVDAGKVVYRLPIMCSTSMSPTFNCNSRVYVTNYAKGEELKVNDIICFNPDYRMFEGNGYRYICHRIIDISPSTNQYLTKGDNNLNWDYWVNPRDIAFKVVNIK